MMMTKVANGHSGHSTIHWHWVDLNWRIKDLNVRAENEDEDKIFPEHNSHQLAFSRTLLGYWLQLGNVRYCQIEYVITDDAGRVCAPPISIFLLVGDGENICMHCLDSIFSSGSEISEISTHHELELPTVGRWEN